MSLLKQSVVRVDINGIAAGTGFFIDTDGSVLTCYHVIQKGKDSVRDSITIHYEDKDYPIECTLNIPESREMDVAVLRLTDKKLPDGAELIPLGKWEDRKDQSRKFRSLGFREVTTEKKNKKPFDEGLWAEGTILGKTRMDNRYFLQLSSEELGKEDIRKKMSGSPVYKEDSGEIVGMITARYTEIRTVDIKAEVVEIIPLAAPVENFSDLSPIVKKRLQFHKLKKEISKILHAEYFTKEMFKTFYESLPINLTKYDNLKGEKTDALLEQLREQQIYDFINWLDVTRPDIRIKTKIQLPPVPRINFVNRNEELKEACGPYSPPYMLFEAPAGYGKTELLKAIEGKHFGEGWLTVYVETPKECQNAFQLACQIAKDAGYDISDSFNVYVGGYALAKLLKEKIKSAESVSHNKEHEKKGVILLIDNIERLQAIEISSFLNEFLKAIAEVIKPIRFRVRLAGRYVGSLWMRESKELPISVIPLTPFQFRYVRDTVQILTPRQEELDLRAAHLMHITGGHPGCMANILERMIFTQSVEEHFKLHTDHYYSEIILPVAGQIRSLIPENLRNIFDTLSVFRRYNLRQLTRIIEEGLIEYQGRPVKLESDLTATYLVKRIHGFIQDEIIKRLLAIRMRYEEPERFLFLCKKAKDIYKNDLLNAVSQPELIAIEGLFQELQIGYYGTDRSHEAINQFSEQFFADNGILHQYIKILGKKADAEDYKANIKTLLKDEKDQGDWEFQFNVNFFLRQEQFNNEPYRKLIEKIEDFFSQESGGDNV